MKNPLSPKKKTTKKKKPGLQVLHPECGQSGSGSVVIKALLPRRHCPSRHLTRKKKPFFSTRKKNLTYTALEKLLRPTRFVGGRLACGLVAVRVEAGPRKKWCGRARSLSRVPYSPHMELRRCFAPLEFLNYNLQKGPDHRLRCRRGALVGPVHALGFPSYRSVNPCALGGPLLCSGTLVSSLSGMRRRLCTTPPRCGRIFRIQARPRLDVHVACGRSPRGTTSTHAVVSCRTVL